MFDPDWQTIGFSSSCILLAIFSLREARRALEDDRAALASWRAVDGWPITLGHVVEAQMEEVDREYEEGGSYRLYIPYVTCAFSTAGGLFRCQKRWPARRDRDDARRQLDRYSVGTSARVAYDPECPERAVVEPENSPPPAISVAALAYFSAAGLTFFLGFLSLAL